MSFHRFEQFVVNEPCLGTVLMTFRNVSYNCIYIKCFQECQNTFVSHFVSFNRLEPKITGDNNPGVYLLQNDSECGRTCTYSTCTAQETRRPPRGFAFIFNHGTTKQKTSILRNSGKLFARAFVRILRQRHFSSSFFSFLFSFLFSFFFFVF